MSEHRYRGPDTSDKRDDECWVEYWDRKRHERHGDNCAAFSASQSVLDYSIRVVTVGALTSTRMTRR